MKSEVGHTLLPHDLNITILLFHYFFIPIPKLKRGHKCQRRQFKREKYLGYILKCNHRSDSYLQILTHGFLWLRVSLTNAHSPQPLTSSHFLSQTHSPPFIFTQHRYRSSQRAQVYFPLHGGCKHWKHKLCLREEVGETTEDALCRRHNGERITMASCRASGTQRGITASGT